jgi:hypothetical protein
MEVLAQYSGWGGLSIESVKKMMPEGLVPETFGLIHEYYTPTVIAEAIALAICPLLPELAGQRWHRAGAGAQRWHRPPHPISFSPRRCLALEAGGQIKKIEWTAVEFSKVSARLLRALRPDIALYHSCLRAMGPRGGPAPPRHVRPRRQPIRPTASAASMAREDSDSFYKEKRAYAYFMRRALDLLVPGGVGVFLVPAGFLSGNMGRSLREKLLLPPSPARRRSASRATTRRAARQSPAPRS